MEDDRALTVNDRLRLPRAELEFRATRAGGPGGQHVNTSSTRVELLWNVERSRALDSDQRARLCEKLAARIDGEGNVRVVASANRSQLRNREEAETRLATMVRRALIVPKPRRATKPTRASKEKRLDTKSRSQKTKRMRGRVRFDD
jgi:ribosome-associated protein